MRVLFVGRLSAPKGIEHLLRACALLRDAGAAPQCEIVGGRTGNEVNYYLRAAQAAPRARPGIDRAVRSGRCRSTACCRAFAAADVVVLPAMQAADGRREVTPNALLEAMAMGSPWSSTPIGGIPEIIEDGVSGLLVPSGDAAALAAALMRLRDPALRARLGAAARERVALRFDLERNIRAVRGAVPRLREPAPSGSGSVSVSLSIAIDDLRRLRASIAADTTRQPIPIPTPIRRRAAAGGTAGSGRVPRRRWR